MHCHICKVIVTEEFFFSNDICNRWWWCHLNVHTQDIHWEPVVRIGCE
jgi:hypothetical protein